ncbi:hypothetical protein HYH03_017869 [Edaphochlamys debaryana]|uniref:Uncharacterized protein n=1 Tax=Edaphochlamys debaryana TaxID=47281 RepID=A0A835XGG4_9CHLO|nr:hypothetical protein HYH03_017869 [Edaphochlamys debaryana]|eukprot:KAG2483271.1 hypothetical protein HYH03_017869 [Edaphochlamys debaryana]
MFINDVIQRAEHVLQRYLRPFMKECEEVEAEVDKLFKASRDVAREQNRARAAAMSAKIRLAKDVLLTEAVPALKKKVKKGTGLTDAVKAYRQEKVKAIIVRIHALPDGMSTAANRQLPRASTMPSTVGLHLTRLEGKGDKCNKSDTDEGGKGDGKKMDESKGTCSKCGDKGEGQELGGPYKGDADKGGKGGEDKGTKGGKYNGPRLEDVGEDEGEGVCSVDSDLDSNVTTPDGSQCHGEAAKALEQEWDEAKKKQDEKLTPSGGVSGGAGARWRSVRWSQEGGRWE